MALKFSAKIMKFSANEEKSAVKDSIGKSVLYQ
jgi:hypothetical protein